MIFNQTGFAEQKDANVRLTFDLLDENKSFNITQLCVSKLDATLETTTAKCVLCVDSLCC